MTPNRGPTSLSNVDVVVFALAELGGAAGDVPHERVAYKAFELAPDRFSWSLPEYSHLPDKDTARVALEDARKAKYGRLVVGSERHGHWRLSETGASWLGLNGQRIGDALHVRPSLPGQKPRDVARTISALKSHAVFREFEQGHLDELPVQALTSLLGCSPDASPRVIRSRFDVLATSAEASGDSQARALVAELRQRFPSLLAKEDFDEAR